MSINWKWKDKIGELKVRRTIRGSEDEFKIDVYKGNADLIFIYEFKSDGVKQYIVYNFFCDIDHFKRCVEDNEIFSEWKELTFYEYNTKIQRYISGFYKLGIKVVIDRNTRCDE